MKRLLVLMALAWTPCFAAAAEPPAPAIEVRVKAIAELTGIIEYAGDLLMQPEAGKQFADMIKIFGAGEKGLEGIDAAHPIGGYVRISENIADSAIVVMVPVKNETAFLGLLKDKLNVEAKKGKGDIYTIEIPQLPIGAVHFRFLHGYAYATIRNVKSIDPEIVLKPKEFFTAADKAILSADIHWDRFPADVKKVMLGQIELQLVEMTKDWGGSELQKLARRGLLDIGVGMVKTMIEDGKQLNVSLDADPKSDTVAANVRLTAMPKTRLETNLKSWADRESTAASLSVAKNPLASLGVIAKIPAGTHAKLGKLIDVVFDDLLASANDDGKAIATKLVDALGPTMKSDDIQLGLLIVKPGKENSIRLHAAVKADKGAELEKVLREFAPFLMGGEASVKFDVEKFAGRNLHEGSHSNEQLKGNFGTENLWIATSDDLLAFGIEEKPKRLKAYLEAKPKMLPMLSLEVSAAQFGVMAEKDVAPEDYTAILQNVYGKEGPAGRDTLKLTISGGRELNVKLELKGRAVTMFVAVDRDKKKK